MLFSSHLLTANLLPEAMFSSTTLSCRQRRESLIFLILIIQLWSGTVSFFLVMSVPHLNVYPSVHLYVRVEENKNILQKRPPLHKTLCMFAYSTLSRGALLAAISVSTETIIICICWELQKTLTSSSLLSDSLLNRISSKFH